MGNSAWKDFPDPPSRLRSPFSECSSPNHAMSRFLSNLHFTISPRRIAAGVAGFLALGSINLSAAEGEKVAHQIGEILPQRPTSGKFQWTHSRGSACEILAIKPGCDCVTVRSFPKSL